jgi:hypothetical protein
MSANVTGGPGLIKRTAEKAQQGSLSQAAVTLEGCHSGRRPSSWYASPATHVGHELIAAGMLILAGGGHGVRLDHGELERWTRVGYERGMRSRKGER